MGNSKADAKNTELLKLLAPLRDYIDIFCIIGLNKSALHESAISDTLMGRIQGMAQEASAMYLCKIFESSNRNELNSIPGIIRSLHMLSLSDAQKQDFAAFGAKYGNHAVPAIAVSYLNETLRLFREIHSESLDRLKDYRDRIGAHSESDTAIDSLPSLGEIEALFSFAADFYKLIAESVNNLSTEVIPNTVSRGLLRLIEQCGVKNPRSDLPDQ